ncbi:MAG TPA: nicotinate-nucleotide adenylyltransferase, partial [Thermoanaerobaculia bacterium]|nr:nicotinate-nucleotide adenylyltransferase [Thermoanaerobaculia bacterium]
GTARRLLSMNIGILGGTFDPFHYGHIEPVLAVREEMEWDRILYVLAKRQPFKSADGAAPLWHRWAMLILGTADHDVIRATDVELARGDVSYTVDTLELIRRDYPDATLDWIIGDDNLAALGAWRNLPRIFELANFVVLTRGNYELPADLQPRVTTANERSTHGNIVFAHNATVPVSSTAIRNRVRAGEPIDAFVDPRVSRYIHHNRLYSEALT